MKINILFFFIALLSLTACKDDDANINDNIPIIAYSSIAYEGAFHVAGTTPEPNIIWRGEEGTIQLVGNPSGISLDPATGVITWDNTLPLGETSFQSSIRNPAGESGANITINNLFKGSFNGGYNNNPNSTTTNIQGFNFIFNGDGTFSVLLGSGATGTYRINGTQIIGDYTYVGGSKFSIKATIINDGAEAYVAGNWYRFHGSLDENLRGYFKIDHVIPTN